MKGIKKKSIEILTDVYGKSLCVNESLEFSEENLKSSLCIWFVQKLDLMFQII